MFDNKKIANIKNELHSDITPLNYDKDKNQEPIFPVKITSVTLSNGVYKYGWTAVKVTDGTNDSNYGSSSNTTLAIACVEIGTTMTNEDSTYKVDDIVAMKRGTRGNLILGNWRLPKKGNVLDLTDPNNDLVGWDLSTGRAVKTRSLIRQHYDSSDDLNYEYYRNHYYYSNGVLYKVDVVVTVNGFQTTLHT